MGPKLLVISNKSWNRTPHTFRYTILSRARLLHSRSNRTALYIDRSNGKFSGNKRLTPKTG